MSAHATRVPAKARDAWWTIFFIDPVAVWLVARLAPHRFVSAAVLTTGSAVVAVIAGVSFALGQPVLGGLLYQLSFLLDCMDGKLAVLRGAENARGGFYDAVADSVRVLSGSTGLVIWLSGETETVALVAALGALYTGLRFAVLMVAFARPWPPQAPDVIMLEATPLAVLRAAPGRRSRPGTTVDTEAIALTVGPVSGLAIPALALAALIDGLHMAAYLVQEIRADRRERRGSAAPDPEAAGSEPEPLELRRPGLADRGRIRP